MPSEIEKKLSLGQRIKRLLTTQAHIAYIGPVSVFVILFIFIPLGVILYFSFLSSGDFGRIIWIFTLENYKALFRSDYLIIFLRTLLFAFGTNIACLLIGYPLAYWIVKYGGRLKVFLLFLVIIPSWVCYLIRLYALKTLTGYTGFLNTILLSLGLISAPLQMLYTPFAVIIGLIYIWLPFMILPIYASLEGLDPSLLEASSDLGATPLRRFLTVTLPLTKGGIYAGAILVFIPCLGTWVVPMLLGGAKVMMMGNLVAMHFTEIGNIPLGSSIAATLTAMVLLLIYLSIKLGGEEVMEKII